MLKQLEGSMYSGRHQRTKQSPRYGPLRNPADLLGGEPPLCDDFPDDLVEHRTWMGHVRRRARTELNIE